MADTSKPAYLDDLINRAEKEIYKYQGKKLIEEFKLEKLTIETFDKQERTNIVSTFTAMFNPETYSLTYKNVLQRDKALGGDREKLLYVCTKPETLSVTLLLDGTGVADPGWGGVGGIGGIATYARKYDVYKEVQEFLKNTLYMDGKVHEPRYLKLKWGDLVFNCRLCSVTVNYKLFNRKGQPLRAELVCEFAGSIQESERIQKKSPDLSHKRTVKSDDNISIMANKIYGDPAYYVRVAQANRLNNFRRLKTEQELQFPPIEK